MYRRGIQAEQNGLRRPLLKRPGCSSLVHLTFAALSVIEAESTCQAGSLGQPVQAYGQADHGADTLFQDPQFW
jgi:hypothetical protein